MTDATLIAKRVLILENEILIRLDLIRILKGAGCEIVCETQDLAQAHDCIVNDKVDMAFLDYREIKNHATSAHFAQLLHDNNVPYTFVTGALKREVQDEYRADARVVEKPFSDQEILDAAFAMA